MNDLDFAQAAETSLNHLPDMSELAAFRLTRRNLGLGHEALGEFHLRLEFVDLAQLTSAVDRDATRADSVETFHHAFCSLITNVSLALPLGFTSRLYI